MGTRLACRRVSAGRWGPEPSVAPATVVLPWMISGTRARLHQAVHRLMAVFQHGAHRRFRYLHMSKISLGTTIQNHFGWFFF
uniref:Uncharacterized protein n=1 Tax=Ralstonia solanacearum TaxID=305 RepID=A0A0S4X3D3_RALSL|nr:protein of unknown function [Ralstonia solanacearum]